MMIHSKMQKMFINLIKNPFSLNSQISPKLLTRQHSNYSTINSSNFSNFMGLTLELQKYRLQQQKNQKKQVRSSSTIIILCFGVFGFGLFVLFNDPMINRRIKLIKFKFNISLNSSQTQQKEATLNYFAEVLLFLKQNPYEYKEILPAINSILNQLLIKFDNIDAMFSPIHELYQEILRHNIKANNNKILHEGITKLVQYGILHHRKIDLNLVDALLQKGNIKQAYLGLIFYQRNHQLSILKNRKKCIENIQTNLRKNIAMSIDRELEEMPQIQFAKMQRNAWIKFIAQHLQLKL